MGRHSTDSLQFHGIINGTPQDAAVTLRSLGNLRHSQGITTIGPDSGATYREVRFVGQRLPEITGSVVALRSLLSTINLLTGSCFTADGGHPGIRAFLQSHNSCGTNARTSGSAHRRITVPKAHALVTQISGSRGQSAVAQVRIIELSTDGEADPDAVVQNAALPGTYIANEEFCIEAPTIAGISIDASNIISWTYETGIQITPIVAAGSLFATAVDITKVEPRWTIQHDDPTLLADNKIPADGIDCAHADTFFQFQKRSPFGGFVDPTESEHIELTAAGFAYHETHYDASGSAVGTGQIVIEGTEGVGGTPTTVALGVSIDGSS